MSDEPKKRTRAWLPWVVVVLSLSSACVLGLVLYSRWCAGWERLNDWESLYNATDGICDYVDRNHKWPVNWESLTSSVAEVGGDVPFARHRVDVDFKSDRKPEGWYVRLKSGSFPNEEREANERLGRVVAWHRTLKIDQPPNDEPTATARVTK